MTSKAIGAGADRWALPACTFAHLHAEGPTAEKRLYISSLPVDPDLALKAVRAHWGIENRLHWTLDARHGAGCPFAAGHRPAALVLVLDARNCPLTHLHIKGKRVDANNVKAKNWP